MQILSPFMTSQRFLSDVLKTAYHSIQTENGHLFVFMQVAVASHYLQGHRYHQSRLLSFIIIRVIIIIIIVVVIIIIIIIIIITVFIFSVVSFLSYSYQYYHCSCHYLFLLLLASSIAIIFYVEIYLLYI